MHCAVQYQHMLHNSGDHALQAAISVGTCKKRHRGRATAKYVLDRWVESHMCAKSLLTHAPFDIQRTRWSASKALETAGR